MIRRNLPNVNERQAEVDQTKSRDLSRLLSFLLPFSYFFRIYKSPL